MTFGSAIFTYLLLLGLLVHDEVFNLLVGALGTIFLETSWSFLLLGAIGNNLLRVGITDPRKGFQMIFGVLISRSSAFASAVDFTAAGAAGLAGASFFSAAKVRVLARIS